MAKGEAITDQQAAFVREYLIDGNATRSAIAAGYSAKTAHAIGNNLRKNPKVAAAIAAGQAAAAERAQITQDDVLNRLWTIANADISQLTRHLVGSCRYCWGAGHLYQWKTPREFDEAVELATVRDKPQPTDDGGYGYRLARDPNPDCPECGGMGHPYTVFADTSRLTPEQKLVFQGVEETRNGMKFNLADRMKALEQVARHLGFFKDKLEHDVSDPLADLIAAAQGSAFPVSTATKTATKKGRGQ